MTSKLSQSSSVSSATLVAINSISATAVAADDKQNHHAAAVVAAVATDNPLKVVSVEQDEITSALDNTEREDRLFTTKSSTAAMKPDVGILSKEFSTKGREQPIGKQFAIHRKKLAAAADDDVGILGNGRRQQKAFDANLHAKNELVGRSLQREGRLPPISREEIISRFNECAFNSGNDKSIVQCYCDSFSYGRCVEYGVAFPDLCEANICCDGQTEDDARLDCFSRFRDVNTGFGLYLYRDTFQESCISGGRSSDQCKCDIQGLSNCVYEEPRCDLFQCCRSQADDDDDGRKDCLVQDETQLLYEECIYYGRSTESCYCYKSSKLCSSKHSDNDRHCELWNCCQEQTDDIGRRECIGNFTTSQPSSVSSETTPTEDSLDEVEASPTATSALPGTSSASIPTPLGAKYHAKITSKMLAVAAVIGWLLFT